MSLAPDVIFKQLTETFPEYSLTFDEAVPCIIVPANAIQDICHQLRDAREYSFEWLMCLSGMDYGDGKLGVVYHLDSIEHSHKLTLKVIVSVENPSVQSVARIWRTADWHEREAYDMFGIVFDGHPDLRRILCPEDWDGWPLRKDYQVQEFYNGMKVPY